MTPTPSLGWVQGLQKRHVIVAVLAATVGFGSVFAADAASYREVDTVAEGVYLLQGEGAAFRVQALGPLTAIVYDGEGTLLLAKRLGDGEARTFLAGEGAILATSGAEAKVSARGPGEVQRLATTSEPVEVIDHDGGPVDETFTFRLPPFVVGLKGKVQGEASELQAEVTSSLGTVLAYRDGEFITDLTKLTRDPMDARIAARNLQGRVLLEVFYPSMPSWDQRAPGSRDHEAMSEAHKEPMASSAAKHREARAEPGALRADEERVIPLGELAEVPLQLTVAQAAEVAFRIQGGMGLDVSLFDLATGAHHEYLQLGATVSEARSQPCQVPAQCMMGSYRYDEMSPEEVAWSLAPGTYLLYVRLAYADGDVLLRGADVKPLEPTWVDVAADGGAEDFAMPVLDLMVMDWSPLPHAQSELRVMLDGNEVYSETRTAALPGFALEEQRWFDPSLLGKGQVESFAGGLRTPGGEARVSVLTIGFEARER